jgi:hypothetical protein
MTNFLRRGTAREQIDAATRHGHEASEHSTPPAPFLGMPVREKQPSLVDLAPHVGRAVGAMKTRIVVLIGVWGTISTMGSAGFAFFMSQQRREDADRMARIEASVREVQHSVDVSIKVLEATAGSWGPRVVELERASKQHGELLASLGKR